MRLPAAASSLKMRNQKDHCNLSSFGKRTRATKDLLTSLVSTKKEENEAIFNAFSSESGSEMKKTC